MARRITINNSSAAIPTKEANIASIRKRPLPECGSQLEKNPIIHSEAGLRASLRAILTRDVNGNVLFARQPVFAATADGLRRKTADLVRLREIFRADGEKNIGSKFRTKWDADLRNPRGTPIRTGR